MRCELGEGRADRRPATSSPGVARAALEASVTRQGSVELAMAVLGGAGPSGVAWGLGDAGRGWGGRGGTALGRGGATRPGQGGAARAWARLRATAGACVAARAVPGAGAWRAARARQRATGTGPGEATRDRR
nr:uncharacterized protein LOC127330390 [Lolium perenne]